MGLALKREADSEPTRHVLMHGPALPVQPRAIWCIRGIIRAVANHEGSEGFSEAVAPVLFVGGNAKYFNLKHFQDNPQYPANLPERVW